MKPQVIVIVGPTASGKTRLAIDLAQQLDTDIISADSMQFYQGMVIGTAAPTPDELAEAPHHFVGILKPDEAMAAGAYEHLARKQVQRLNESRKIAVAVGGSGLYVSALVDGLFEGPARDPEIRERLKAEAREQGNARMMERLRSVDPAYAELLTSENDLVRIVRALEVYELTGEPFSKWHQDHQAQLEPLDALQFGLQWDRELLYARINRRVDLMMETGWVEEVQALLDAGYGEHIERLKALGFREIAAALRGEQTMEEAVEATKMHHRRYAKRQLTWFRGDERVTWLPAGPEITTAQQVETILRRVENQQT